MSWTMKFIFACGYGSTEVTNFYDYFKWVWPGIPKVIENNDLVITQKYSKMNLGMYLNFCLWLGIQKYIYMIQSIYMGLIRHTCECKL